MKLYIVRHGDALPRERDPDCPLSARGRADAERLAGFLRAGGIRAVRVVHSGKTRARQTADALARAVTPGKESEARTGLDPNDPTDALVSAAGRAGDDMVVVGHLPFVGRLVARLVVGREDAAVVVFRPGAMVCLERGLPSPQRSSGFAQAGESGGWTIAWMLGPELWAG